ncbi:MAG: 16S rRNA (guanine(966)-N(2))-methyltransferase RsmD [Arcanobacterium sp.]|nr:16S rRNA (guanine(966)-N(2))-methyltransferase RsmD [Arcanobacterium sp.]
MTRIVAGTAKGRMLQVPKSGTRPTSERVREALFSRIEHYGYLKGSRVLDLFAGSGALGLEAASRGAAEVIAVEANANAVRVIRANAQETGLRLDVYQGKAETYLVTAASGEFDLVLIDPPYDYSDEALEELLLALSPHLCADAMILVERSKHSPEPVWPAGIALADQRSWGDTRVWTAFMQDE